MLHLTCLVGACALVSWKRRKDHLALTGKYGLHVLFSHGTYVFFSFHHYLLFIVVKVNQLMKPGDTLLLLLFFSQSYFINYICIIIEGNSFPPTRSRRILLQPTT